MWNNTGLLFSSSPTRTCGSWKNKEQMMLTVRGHCLSVCEPDANDVFDFVIRRAQKPVLVQFNVCCVFLDYLVSSAQLWIVSM